MTSSARHVIEGHAHNETKLRAQVGRIGRFQLNASSAYGRVRILAQVVHFHVAVFRRCVILLLLLLLLVLFSFAFVDDEFTIEVRKELWTFLLLMQLGDFNILFNNNNNNNSNIWLLYRLGKILLEGILFEP